MEDSFESSRPSQTQRDRRERPTPTVAAASSPSRQSLPERRGPARANREGRAGYMVGLAAIAGTQRRWPAAGHFLGRHAGEG